MKTDHWRIPILLWSSLWLTGCSNNAGKLRLMEVEFQREKTERLTLQTRVDSLRAVLTETKFLAKAYESELQRKDAAIKQLTQPLDSIQGPADVEIASDTAAVSHDSEIESAALPETSAVEEKPLESVAVEVAPPAPTVETAPKTEPIGTGDYQTHYDRALGQFREKAFSQAMASFETLLNSDRNHKLAGNCQFWMGESYYALGDYESALAEFQKVMAYPRSYKLDAAQFKAGLCCLKLGRNEDAREEFKRLISGYPTSEYVGKARAQLEKLP